MWALEPCLRPNRSRLAAKGEQIRQARDSNSRLRAIVQPRYPRAEGDGAEAITMVEFGRAGARV